MNAETASYKQTNEEMNRHIRAILEEIDDPLFSEKQYYQKVKEQIAKEKKSSFIIE